MLKKNLDPGTRTTYTLVMWYYLSVYYNHCFQNKKNNATNKPDLDINDHILGWILATPKQTCYE
jgi:hypothetical protein